MKNTSSGFSFIFVGVGGGGVGVAVGGGGKRELVYFIIRFSSSLCHCKAMFYASGFSCHN